MKYLHRGDRIGIACHLCEPPNGIACAKCKRRVNPKYPASVIWINREKYVIAESESQGMNKYIKLEDIETLITACEWRMTLAKERHGQGFVDYSKQVLDVDELTKRLTYLPTIDIVHCGECKHYKTDIPQVGGTYNGCGVWIDDGNEIEVEPSQFCSKGERIEE